ncbi:MAG: glutaredoxin family protein [Elusimicrobiota bacterium]
MALKYTKVNGNNKGKVVVYALSTCGWCKKTKQLLATLGAEYEYIDVDTITGADLDELKKVVYEWNPVGSFPTIVINDKDCIVGFDEDKIKKSLK